MVEEQLAPATTLLPLVDLAAGPALVTPAVGPAAALVAILEQ